MLCGKEAQAIHNVADRSVEVLIFSRELESSKSLGVSFVDMVDIISGDVNG